MSAPVPKQPPEPGAARLAGEGDPRPRGRIGAWFIGARGSVATTATVGSLALGAGLGARTGCVTELPEISGAGLPGIGDIVIGGHDVSAVPLTKRAEELAASGVVPAHLPAALTDALAAVDARLRPGVRALDEEPQRATAARVEADLRAFRDEHRLDRVVVVDLTSTEPPAPQTPALSDPDALERALDAGESPLPGSSLYAYAALRAGCPLVAFTPSPSVRPPALTGLAERMGLPWAGSDAKTGETLVKTALAPLFATRALQVRSWASYNLLGGGDGATLASADNAASKITTKGRGLESILGHPVDGPLHIDYAPDLGDWKTAWDHISFEGFLGVRMSLQFTWAGCDSALAAPLVLDLVRLMARAHETGATGPVGAFGFFFKDPAGSEEHRLAAQWEELTAWCARAAAGGGA
ncbi:myo-inositol-1-phosphate synthase [Spinactinospora alkalitolerans]|uniref:Myo-inositol-1-phosphate synthase n=1 Tax=Spinactinospora alkalitolerans TaxID=687207 RepID=A0A852TQW7_9ACTN|nr:inositol-3-phosphate synthase [Spinactinospora alkalitolerans]NYE46379.1 myo-inositol-1-phosphate synthase [Spinactinospora alkalitolerans]